MTPLILLVGFLGAGKTTYLRQLLPQLRAQGVDPHVIINDYQNARVDAELLRELTDSVVPISGSCVCCGSREELLGALETFAHAPGRAVVIETNGTTDSEELIELLSLEPTLERFTQPIQLSVIDGHRWQKRFWHNSLELDQATTASFLFIARADEIDANRRARLEESIEHHGIHATPADPETFAREIAGIVAAVRDLPDRDAVAHEAGCACGHHGDGDHEQHHHHEEPAHDHSAHHFASLQIDLPPTVARGTIIAFLDGLPPEVIRVKGLARLADSPEEYHVFQKVDSSAVQWLPIGRTSRLSHPLAVLIGPGIEADAIRARAAELFAGEPAQAAS
ncbi:MAG: GTP-binding protein [Terrimicrobiaceae bacterium]|nr:GTP-binding protein [Terrimicrobiaceae bacterium]